MDIQLLEEIMITHGIVLRAIPRKVRGVYDKRHLDKYPNGIITYLEEYKRDMLVVETIPQNAGKFIFESVKSTRSTVSFSGKKYFDSIEEAIEHIQKNIN